MSRNWRKKCIKCKVNKKEDDFYFTNSKKRFKRGSCKECDIKNSGKRAKIRNKLNPDPRKNSILKIKYGITIEDYKSMLKKQNHLCKICGTSKPGGAQKVFVVDHCHRTGKVRGLLCYKCNLGLGSFDDNKLILLAAVEYLKCA